MCYLKSFVTSFFNIISAHKSIFGSKYEISTINIIFYYYFILLNKLSNFKQNINFYGAFRRTAVTKYKVR